MLNSVHYFNPDTQQIYRLKSKGKFTWFFSKNAGKYLAYRLMNLFVGLRILLLGMGFLAFLL